VSTASPAAAAAAAVKQETMMDGGTGHPTAVSRLMPQTARLWATDSELNAIR